MAKHRLEELEEDDEIEEAEDDAEDVERKPKRKPVATGRKRKKTGIQKFADEWFVGEISDFGRFLGKKVIKPAIKGAIIDLVETACEGFGDGLQMLFFNEDAPRRRRRGGRNSYSDYYESDRKRKRRKRRNRYEDFDDDDDDDYEPRKRISFEYVEFRSRKDAKNALEDLNEILDEHDYVTVADYYQTGDISPEWTDYDYGWESTKRAVIVNNGNWYTLEMPRPKYIK